MNLLKKLIVMFEALSKKSSKYLLVQAAQIDTFLH